MTPDQQAALAVLIEQLNDSIDGGEECRGRDTQLTRWIELAEFALGKAIDPWALMIHAPAIKQMKEQMGKV